jgi:DnaJ-domain-containing protein 1
VEAAIGGEKWPGSPGEILWEAFANCDGRRRAELLDESARIEQEKMSSRAPKSFVSLLLDIVRVSVRTFWESNANPARPILQRQQALGVLGLPPTATPQQIKRRYRTLAKRHHPDRGGDPREMQRIIAAYEFLVKEQNHNH